MPPNNVTSDQGARTTLVLNAADRLAAMADKVAGFAISSNLLLIFACLKDIGPWVQHQTVPFLVGIGTGGLVYVAAVWWLYGREISTRAMVSFDGSDPTLDSVSCSLVWARSLGITAFAIIAMLAVWGTRAGITP
jgi:hypothetical protein